MTIDHPFPPRPPAITTPKAHIPLKPPSPTTGSPASPSPDLQPVAVEAVTERDTVVILENGERLPGVSLSGGAQELEDLVDEVQARRSGNPTPHPYVENEVDGENVMKEGVDLEGGVDLEDLDNLAKSHNQDAFTEVEIQKAPANTNPLFPPLPIWGPPSTMRWVQCMVFRATSSVLSFLFLVVVLLGAMTEGVGPLAVRWWKVLRGVDPDGGRPWVEYERERIRKVGVDGEGDLRGDLDYYARRVGLRIREEEVQTEDGFVLSVQRLVDPEDEPEGWARPRCAEGYMEGEGEGKRRPRYPVLLMHGLLQSSGAYCVNEERSLAFYLAKCGYDVWLGNNRCHFKPQHTILDPSDPRMWAWNICQMGNLDLPCLVSHALSVTGFPKLGYVAHSQGTTQTFITLSSSQRPALGSKLSIFCALAPAVYAGGLVEKLYFRFMRIISPGMFRLWFGIHGFIPLMLWMRDHMPWWIYGDLGYAVFWFLFGWSDTRWDRTLRRRFFIFSPTLVSAEAMRWWLGRECFATKKCILGTVHREVDPMEDEAQKKAVGAKPSSRASAETDKAKLSSYFSTTQTPIAPSPPVTPKEEEAPWFPKTFPPLAMWVAGADTLVNGFALLERFKSGKEPEVEVVHAEVVPDYEHLDVLWAVDAIDRVGRGVAREIWKAGENERRRWGVRALDWEYLEGFGKDHIVGKDINGLKKGHVKEEGGLKKGLLPLADVNIRRVLGFSVLFFFWCL